MPWRLQRLLKYRCKFAPLHARLADVNVHSRPSSTSALHALHRALERRRGTSQHVPGVDASPSCTVSMTSCQLVASTMHHPDRTRAPISSDICGCALLKACRTHSSVSWAGYPSTLLLRWVDVMGQIRHCRGVLAHRWWNDLCWLGCWAFHASLQLLQLDPTCQRCRAEYLRYWGD
jgi:hypothetical protein